MPYRLTALALSIDPHSFGDIMLKGIAIATLLMLPGSFNVLGLACIHPGLRRRATTLVGIRHVPELWAGPHWLQRRTPMNRDGRS